MTELTLSLKAKIEQAKQRLAEVLREKPRHWHDTEKLIRGELMGLRKAIRVAERFR